MVVDLGELCPGIWPGGRVASSGRQSLRWAGCSAILAHPAAEGAAHLYLLLDKDAPCPGLLNRGLQRGVDGCLSKQTTYGHFYFFSGAMDCAFATFVLGKGLLS